MEIANKFNRLYALTADRFNSRVFWSVLLFIAPAFIYESFAPLSGLLVLDMFLTVYLKDHQLGDLGIEFSTSAVILAGLFFGPGAGALVGFAAITANLWVASDFAPTWVPKIVGFTLAGFAAGILGGEITLISLVVPIVMRSVFFLFVLLYNPDIIGETLIYESTSAIFAFIFLREVGPALLQVMA
jgi:hypothetical protein